MGLRPGLDGGVPAVDDFTTDARRAVGAPAGRARSGVAAEAANAGDSDNLANTGRHEVKRKLPSRDAGNGRICGVHKWPDLTRPPRPGAGSPRDGTRWIACRPGFLLPVRVLSRLFRRLFSQVPRRSLRHRAAALRRDAGRPDRASHVRRAPSARAQDRVGGVRQPPFGGPQQVLDYVGRYTHRVAISDDLLLDLEAGHVRFRYRNSRSLWSSAMAGMRWCRRPRVWPSPVCGPPSKRWWTR